MKKYIVEFIGTFFLVLTIALTGNPIAIGAILIAMIYMGGYISGAHYNPAVTLAVLIRGKINQIEAGRYMISQVIGGGFAAFVFLLVKGSTFTPTTGLQYSMLYILLLEVLFTFALASVVLHVATSEKTAGNQYYGLAIGLTVMAGAFAAGPISGGVFNPAVALGPYLFKISALGNNLNNLILYLVGPLTGGALAGLVYNWINKK